MASKASNFVVEVRDRDFTRQGQIAAEFLDLLMVERFRAVGAWQLKLPAEHPRLNDLKQKGSGIIVTERIRREVPQAPEYSDWIETARNLLVNPAFTVTAGPLEVRRNKMPYPGDAPTGTAGWTTYRTAVTNPGGFIRGTVNTSPAPGGACGIVGSASASTMVAATPGQVWTVVAELRASGVGRHASLAIQYYDASLTYITGSQTLGAEINGDPDVWQEASVTATAPAGTAYFRVLALRRDNSSIGEYIDIRRATAELSAAPVGPPFSGNYSYSPDLAASWAGPADASEAILTGTRVADVVNHATVTLPPYRISTSRGVAARHTLLSTLATAISVGTAPTSSGQTYTEVFRARASRPTLVRTRINGTSDADYTLTTEWQELRATVIGGAANPLTTGLYVYADNNRPAGTTIDIETAVLADGVYAGDYFGPASTSDDTRRYVAGPNGSTIKEERTRTDLPPLVVYDPKVYSGRMQSAVLSQDATDPKGTWLITGVDDNIIGSAVNVLPDPAHTADLQESDYWNYAGDGETVMKAAVGLNAGPYAIPARSYPWLTLAANQNRGLAVSASARFNKLGDLLGSLGIKSGLGWRFTQQGDDIEFDVFEPEDKSAWIRLDIRNGGLQSTELGYSAPTATDAFVLGQGQGVERTVRVVTSPEATAEAELWGLRWEVAKDQRNTDDPTELQQAGEEILTEQGTTVHSLKVTPSDAPNQRIGIDWGLGDIVTVILDDAPAKATVTEIATSVTSAGVIRTATVGDPVGYDWEAKVANRVREHETRIGDLERLVDTGVTWDGVSGKPTEFPTRAPLAPAGQQVTDWDLAIDNGFYWGNDAANAPFAGMVMAQTIRDGSGRIIQEAPDPANLLYSRARRVYSGGVWGAWKIVGPEGLPANQAAAVTGTITATGAFAAFGPTLSFTFDTPTWVRVDLAGWISAAASTDLRVGVQASGATTQAANEAYGEISWGHVLWVSNDYEQRFMSKEVLCAPGTTDFRPAAYKIGSGAATVSYGMLAVAPQRRG